MRRARAITLHDRKCCGIATRLTCVPVVWAGRHLTCFGGAESRWCAANDNAIMREKTAPDFHAKCIENSSKTSHFRNTPATEDVKIAEADSPARRRQCRIRRTGVQAAVELQRPRFRRLTNSNLCREREIPSETLFFLPKIRRLWPDYEGGRRDSSWGDWPRRISFDRIHESIPQPNSSERRVLCSSRLKCISEQASMSFSAQKEAGIDAKFSVSIPSVKT